MPCAALRLGAAAQRLQCIKAAEGVDRGRILVTHGDRRDAPVDRLDRYAEILEGGQPFGDPGTLVEQGGSVAKACEVYLDHGLTEPGDRFGVETRGLAVAEEFAIFRLEHADTQASIGQGPGRGAARIGIACVEALCDPPHLGAVAHRQRENADTIEAAAGGDQAGGAEQTRRRLDPDDVVERRGDPAQAGGVGAERKAGEAGGHRYR